MLPPADASPPSSDDDSSARYADDRGSSRSLDEVGAVAVLGAMAMVEQRRRASVAAASELELDPCSSRPCLLEDGDSIATQRRQRLDPSDDVFQKIR